MHFVNAYFCYISYKSEVETLSLINLILESDMNLYVPKIISATEMILGNDGKLRYPKPLRLKMYEAVLDALREALGIQDLSPLTDVNKHKPLFYFCMEFYPQHSRPKE